MRLFGLRQEALASILLLVAVLAASPTPASALDTRVDIPYVPGGGHKQQLDLYLPAGKGFPILLFVHGGSLTSGDRKDEDHPPMARAFAGSGFGVAVMSYRLFPDAPWPAPAEDVASALAWLNANARSFGGRPDRMFLLGHSSGAALVARLVSDPRYLARVGMSPTDVAGAVAMGTILKDQEFEESMERAAAKGMQARLDSMFRADPDYSMYGSVETYVDSWPLHHVNAAMPPLLITVAEAERFQPPCLASAEAFRDSARHLGARVEVAVLPDRDHYSALRRLAEPHDPTFERIRSFFDNIADTTKSPTSKRPRTSH